MTKNDQTHCQTCETIPPDAVFSAEAADYVEHYCGRETLNGYLTQAHEAANRNPFVSAQPLI